MKTIVWLCKGLFSGNPLWKLFLVGLTGLALPTTVSILCQAKLLTQGQHRLEITLEIKDETSARAVDPGLVFQQGDQVRFRVRSHFDGYLYVMNRSTSGEYATLFPREDTGQINSIQADRNYLVPATEGWFKITGPPGQEIVYWLISPVQLQVGSDKAASAYTSLPPPPKAGKLPPNLIPRCDDTLFKARGDCIDSSAGAKPISDPDRLPEKFAALPGAGSRELTFLRNENSTLVSSPDSIAGPVIFEFRLAHR